MVNANRKSSFTKKLALAAMLAAAAVIMHSVESLLPPLVIGVPVRLGLANIFTLLSLMLLGWQYALAVSVLRCLAAMLITGAVSQLPYSLTGVILSFLAMLAVEPLRKRNIISAVGSSVVGSFAFNIGQLAVGVLMAGRAMIYYFPIISLLSIPTGIFTGLVSHFIFRALRNSIYARTKQEN